MPIGAGAVFANETLIEALGSAAAYAEAEKAEATRRAYASDIAQFAAWGRQNGTTAPPASVALVAAYLAWLADGGRKASTINRRCAAIADWHRRHGLETPTSAEPVRAVLRGIRRTIGTRTTQKAPATDKVIAAMIKRIPDTLRGHRDRALLLVCFAAALRRSELVALEVASLERVPEGVLLHVARSKTDQDGAGQTIPIPRGGKLAVVERLDAWLAAAAIVEGPLFRSVGKGGQVGAEALSDRAVALVIKDRAAAAGLDPDAVLGPLAARRVRDHGAREGRRRAESDGRHPAPLGADAETLRPAAPRPFRNHAGKGISLMSTFSTDLNGTLRT